MAETQATELDLAYARLGRHIHNCKECHQTGNCCERINLHIAVNVAREAVDPHPGMASMAEIEAWEVRQRA